MIMYISGPGLDQGPAICIFPSIPAESVAGGSEALRNMIRITQLCFIPQGISRKLKPADM